MDEAKRIAIPPLTEEEAAYLRKLQEASDNYDRTKVIGPAPAAHAGGQGMSAHAEYDAAAKARDAARKRYHEAERAFWDAEREWDDAERRVQRAFVNLANAPSLMTEQPSWRVI